MFVKEEILYKELLVFFRYIAYCDFDGCLHDALSLLLEIFKSNFFVVERIEIIKCFNSTTRTSNTRICKFEIPEIVGSCKSSSFERTFDFNNLEDDS